MNIHKEIIENKKHINNSFESDEEKSRVEEAKSRAMSKERRAITNLFKGIQFKVEDSCDTKK